MEDTVQISYFIVGFMKRPDATRNICFILLLYYQIIKVFIHKNSYEWDHPIPFKIHIAAVLILISKPVFTHVILNCIQNAIHMCKSSYTPTIFNCCLPQTWSKLTYPSNTLWKHEEASIGSLHCCLLHFQWVAKYGTSFKIPPKESYHFPLQ